MTEPMVLDEATERLLDELAAQFGGRAAAVSEAIRLLAEDVRRKEVLDEFTEAFDRAWSPEGGPVDPRAVDNLMEKFERFDESF